MGNIFAPVARRNNGAVLFNVGSGAVGESFSFNGLRMDANGAIYAISGGVITHRHAGLPFDENGRLVISQIADVDYFDQGVGFSVNGYVVCASLQSHADQGVWFDNDGSLFHGGGSGSVWILATGYWNDGGEWIDTDFWIDGPADAWILATGFWSDMGHWHDSDFWID